MNANQFPEFLQRSKWNRNLTVKAPLDILPLEDIVNEVQPVGCRHARNELYRIISGWSVRRARFYRDEGISEAINAVRYEGSIASGAGEDAHKGRVGI